MADAPVGTLIPVPAETPLFAMGDKVTCTQTIGKTVYGPYDFAIDKIDGPDKGGIIRVSGMAQDGKRHTVPQKICKKVEAPAPAPGPAVLPPAPQITTATQAPSPFVTPAPQVAGPAPVTPPPVPTPSATAPLEERVNTLTIDQLKEELGKRNLRNTGTNIFELRNRLRKSLRETPTPEFTAKQQAALAATPAGTGLQPEPSPEPETPAETAAAPAPEAAAPPAPAPETPAPAPVATPPGKLPIAYTADINEAVPPEKWNWTQLTSGPAIDDAFVEVRDGKKGLKIVSPVSGKQGLFYMGTDGRIVVISYTDRAYFRSDVTKMFPTFKKGGRKLTQRKNKGSRKKRFT